MTAAKFIPKNTNYRRQSFDTDTDGNKFEFETTFDTSATYPSVASMEVLTNDSLFYKSYTFTDFVNESSNSEILCPYILPRNFKLASADSKFLDYRLLCYDFFHVLRNSGFN